MDECIEDADPGRFGIQTAIEWAIRLQLESYFNYVIGHDPTPDEDADFEDGWASLLDEIVGRVRPNLNTLIQATAEALAAWVNYDRYSWIEEAKLADPFDRIPKGAVEYLVGLLVLGVVPASVSIDHFNADRLWLHKVAGGQ